MRNHQVSSTCPARPASCCGPTTSDAVCYQVLGANGEFLSGERDLPQPAEDDAAGSETVHLRNDEFRAHRSRWPTPGSSWNWQARNRCSSRWPKPWTSARCWPPRSSRRAAAAVRDPAAGRVAGLGGGAQLRDQALHRLESRIRRRKPDDLSPIELEGVPQELAPVVGSVNDLLDRLKSSISTQKRFLADAAHQLKTPLAACACRPTWPCATVPARR